MRDPLDDILDINTLHTQKPLLRHFCRQPHYWGLILNTTDTAAKCEQCKEVFPFSYKTLVTLIKFRDMNKPPESRVLEAWGKAWGRP